MRGRSAPTGPGNYLYSGPGSVPRRISVTEPYWGAAPTGTAPEEDQSMGGGRSLGLTVFEPGGRRPAARTTWPLQQTERLVHDALRRAEAAAVHRAGADQRPRGGVSGRVDHRARPAVAPGHLGTGARHPRSWQ